MPKSFLDLPGEIRNQIYHLSLVDPDPICIGTFANPSTSYQTRLFSWDAKVSANLLAACRQVKEEAAPVLYQQNQFDFEGWRDVPWFLMRIGRFNDRLLDNFTITYTGRENALLRSSECVRAGGMGSPWPDVSLRQAFPTYEQ